MSPEFLTVSFPIDPTSVTRLARESTTKLAKKQASMQTKMIQIRAAAPGTGDSYCGHCGRGLNLQTSLAPQGDSDLGPTP
jgi:hypothetical protein